MSYNAKKYFLVRQVDKRFFNIETPERYYEFNPRQYSSIVSIEPYDYPFEVIHTNPIIIKNPDEILPAHIAKEKLNIPDDKPVCCISISGYETESTIYTKYYDEDIRKKYYCITSSNYNTDLIFPIVTI